MRGVGVDLYTPFLSTCKRASKYDDVILADARLLPLKSKTIDTVLAIDLIEHLPKLDGYRLLSEMERVATHQVILTTPVGHMEMFHQGLSEREGELQQHRSGWRPHELRQQGYNIRGNFGPKLLPRDVAYFMSFLLPLSYFFPECAHHMLCTKAIREEHLNDISW